MQRGYGHYEWPEENVELVANSAAITSLSFVEKVHGHPTHRDGERNDGQAAARPNQPGQHG